MSLRIEVTTWPSELGVDIMITNKNGGRSNRFGLDASDVEVLAEMLNTWLDGDRKYATASRKESDLNHKSCVVDEETGALKVCEVHMFTLSMCVGCSNKSVCERHITQVRVCIFNGDREYVMEVERQIDGAIERMKGASM